MQDKLSNWVPLSACEMKTGVKGVGLLNLPFKRLGLGKELAQCLLNNLSVHAEYAYKMRTRLLKPLIKEVRQLQILYTNACAELEMLGLSKQGSIADYYAQHIEELVGHAKLVAWQSLSSIRLLRAECKKILMDKQCDYENNTAMAFFLGQLCSEIETARYLYFYQEQQIRSKLKYGSKNAAKGQWQSELGWRLYFDYWIKGQTIAREEFEREYLDLLPKLYTTDMNPKTLAVAISQQQKIYYGLDKRVPKPASAGRKLKKIPKLNKSMNQIKPDF